MYKLRNVGYELDNTGQPFDDRRRQTPMYPIAERLFAAVKPKVGLRLITVNATKI
ncbi:MAG: hypothetical protein WA828_13155 [Coleofasciculaceae cyanobacterium]